MQKKSKSQMEIFGLLIIVILIALGLLFAVYYLYTKPDSKAVQRGKESLLAANFLNTLLGTTTDCREKTVRDLLQDCARTGGALNCDGPTTCQKAQEVIGRIMSNTLDSWSTNYRFFMNGTQEVEAIAFSHGECTGELESKTHALPVGGFDVTLTLDICR